MKISLTRYLRARVVDLQSHCHSTGRGYLVVPLGDGEGEGYRYMNLQLSASGWCLARLPTTFDPGVPFSPSGF